MCFIQMIQIRIKTDFIHQFSTTNTKQNKLRHFGSHIGIVQAMCDGLRYIIIFRKIGTQEEKEVPF